MSDDHTNPRYLAYCKAMGCATAEEMLLKDKEEWPGGIMTGFILWTNRMWDEWCKINRVPRHELFEEDHINFDKWLKVKDEGLIE